MTTMHSTLLRPSTIREASAFVSEHHRHHKAPRGARFAIAAENAGQLVGVVIVGRPVARALQDGYTAEIVRLCSIESAPLGTPSRLMRAAWRAWAQMGGKRIITYTLTTESGASLRGAGFRNTGMVRAKRWSTKSRPRAQRAVERLSKLRWELIA